MDKFKLASSSLGERLKTGGAQMSRIVSTKMKEILQTPTPESKIVDEATSENMEEPNWGMNLRICAMINSEEYSGSGIVKAIKKKISAKSAVSQKLSLDLLEACTSNCEKVFSEVASEKLLDEMVRMIEDPRTDNGNRDKALQLIRAWGESEDLKYLPVFHQTYMRLQTRGTTPPPHDGNQQPMSPPEGYPLTDFGLDDSDHTTVPYSYGSQSIEQKREFLVITRNSLDLLSSILNSETETKSIKDDLTVSILDKCKQSLPVVQRIVESTTDDEVMLFEALNLHDELQQIISRCEEMEASLMSGGELPENTDTTEANLPVQVETHNETKAADLGKELSSESSGGETRKAGPGEEESNESTGETKKADSSQVESFESGAGKRSDQ